MTDSQRLLDTGLLNNLFKAFWEARASNDFDMMLEILVDINSRLAFPFAPTTPIDDLVKHLEKLDEPLKSLSIESIVCKTGFDRIKIESISASSALKRIFELVKDFSLSNSARFALYFEMGCLLFSEDILPKALDCFMTARQYASSDLKLYINSLQCLHCDSLLNTKLPKIYDETKKYAAALEAELHGTDIREKILLPFKIYIFKEHFLNAQLTPWLQSKTYQSDILFNSYEFNWATSLPYCHLAPLLQQTITSRIDSIKTWSAYQRRTLLSRWDHTDALANDHILIIERIYLWVWRWLHEPDLISTEKINLALQSLNLSERIKISPAHLAMLKNSILWISIFGSDQIEESCRFGRYIYCEVAEAPLALSMEGKVISYLLANLDSRPEEANELLNEIQNLIECYSELSFFSKFTCEFESHSKDCKIKINLRDMTIQKIPTADSKGQTINSETLCSALILLRIYGRVSYELFSKFVFGTEIFEHESHERQIFNLVARIRKIFAADTELEIFVKKGQVLSQGNWCHIKFEEEQKLAQLANSLKENSSKVPNLKNFDGVITKTSLKEKLFADLAHRNLTMFTRKNLQHFLKLSKSSAGRLLKQLVVENEIRCIKKGPNATYILVSKKLD